MPDPFTDTELDAEIEHAEKLATIAQMRGESVAATATNGLKRALIAERDDRAASKARAEARTKEQEAADAERDAKNAEAAAAADRAEADDTTAAERTTDTTTMLDRDDNRGQVEDPADFAPVEEPSTPSTGDASAAVQPPVPEGAVISEG